MWLLTKSYDRKYLGVRDGGYDWGFDGLPRGVWAAVI